MKGAIGAKFPGTCIAMQGAFGANFREHGTNAIDQRESPCVPSIRENTELVPDLATIG
jgi:hypothetical protein